MIKGLNIFAGSAGEHINTMAYMVECRDCGHRGFVSTSKGKMPLCPKCSGQNGIDYKELMEEAIGFNTGTNELMFKDGSTMELKMSNRMKEQMEEGLNTIATVMEVFCGVTERKAPKTAAKDKKAVAEISNAPISKKPNGKKKSSAITDDDLDYILLKIQANLTGKFKNKDLAPLVADRFTARQTPSRLKRMVDAGMLECDNASPKNYWIAQ